MKPCAALSWFLTLTSALFLVIGCAPESVKKESPAAEPGTATDITKGKSLFEDPKLGGGTSGKSCASCHPNGKGLEGVADKNEFKAMGKTYTSLADVSNYFIETAQKGKPLDANSAEMKYLIAYMKSLKR